MCEKFGKYKIRFKFGNPKIGLEKFGTGGVGEVYLAENEEEKDKKRMYVLKILKEDKTSYIDKVSFNEEIQILKKLSKDPENKYTPTLYGSQEYNLEEDETKIKGKNKEKIKPFYTIDFISNSCLFDYAKSKKLFKNKRVTKLLFKKIIEAVKFLHDRNIYHLDLKPDNIMIDKDYEPLIIDFGSSMEIIGQNKEINLKESCKIRTGKPYTCPELHEKEIINAEKVDIFSLGVILFNLVTGGIGFGSTNNNYLYNLIKYNTDNFEAYWEKIKSMNEEGNYNLNLELSEEFKKLYLSMVAYNPSERPTIKDILESDWLKDINDLNEEEKEKLEEEYRKELSVLIEEIRREDEKLDIVKKIIKEGGYITRALEGEGEYNNLFPKDKEELKPKKIINDTIHINLCIEIKVELQVIDFMNSLIIGICEDLKGNCKPSDDSLKIEVFFEKNEEIGICTMDIELFEYEKGKYLLEFMRTEGEKMDYYHYFMEIKKMISSLIN